MARPGQKVPVELLTEESWTRQFYAAPVNFGGGVPGREGFHPG